MAKIAKRSFAVLLCVLIAVASFIGCFSVTAASDVLFKDEFTASAPTGWASSTIGSVANGSYKISGTTMNTIAGQTFSAGKGIVANLAIGRMTDSATNAYYANGTASIVFNASQDGKSYYEFGMGIRQNGSAYLMAYLNRADGNSMVIKKQSTNINGVANGKIRENTTYELKVIALNDGKLQFMVNNQLFAEVTDVLKSGAVGVATYNAVAILEDIQLQNIGEKKVESIQVLNVPTSAVAVGDALGIKVQANYAGIYGSQILDEEAQGLVISGYPSKEGKATLKATFGGKSDSFEVNFSGFAKDELVYEANFASASGWTLGKSADLATYVWQIKNNKLTLEYPDVTGFDKVLKAIATCNQVAAADLAKVSNYRIDATATITNDNETPTADRVGSAEIFVCNGYSVRVTLNGTVTLYQGTTAISAGKVSGIKLGQKFTVSIDVYANIWTISVNGAVVITYASSSAAVPVIKFQAVNGGVDVHSYKLTKLATKSIWYIKSATLVDSFGAAIKKVAARRLPLNEIFINAVYQDGSSRKLPVTEEMISGYNANTDKAHTITVNYAGFTKTFTYEPNNFLFTDTFDKEHKGNWSFTHPEYAAWTAKDGKLVVDYYDVDPAGNRATIAICKGIAAMDLAVGADFMLTEARRTTYMGVQFRKAGANFYEYRLAYNTKNGTFAAELYRFIGNSGTMVKKWAHTDILDLLGTEYLSQNEVFSLRAEAMGREIYMYINGKMLDVYVDDHPDAIIQSGECTVKTINASAQIDNFYIEEVTPRQPKNLKLLGVENGVINLYKGFELEPGKYDLQVTFDDGLVVTVPLSANYLSQIDGFAEGDTKVTITYGSLKTSITIRVTERPEYVQEFVDKMDKIDLATLTADSKATVYEAKDHFDTLSPWEISNLPEATYKKYVDMIEKMDRLLIPEIEGKDQLYYNDFSTEATEEEWNFQHENSKVGTWDTRNGYIINEQYKHGVSGNGWAVLKNVYGAINAVVVDLAMVYPGTYTAIAWNLTVDGAYYHCRMTNKLTNDEGKAVYAVQLYRYNGGHKKVKEIYTDIYEEIFVAEGNFNTLRITQVDNLVTVYLDDKLIFGYTDSSNLALFEGGVGFRSSENDSMYDNLRVYGTAKERPTMKEKEIEPTYYEDNFEDETVGKSPSHWQEEYKADEFVHVDAWKVYNKGGSKVYGTTGGKTSYSVLHAFEADPEITTKFMYTGSGKVGILTRFYPKNRVEDADAFTVIGYDTATKKWFVTATESTLQDEIQTVWADKATSLSAGEMHDLQIVLTGANLVVTVDGAEVLKTDALRSFAFGKMGVFAQSAAMYIDDLKIKSVNGTGFYEGVEQFTFFVSQDGTTHTEMEILSDNKMVAMSGNNYVSYDKGHTWAIIGEEDNVSKAPTGGIGYTSIQGYGNGEFISINGGDFGVWRSTDNMKTWTQISNVITKAEMYDVYGNNCAIIHVGSLTNVKLQDGTLRTFLPIAWRRYDSQGTSYGHYTRFFYSDDHGKTWTESTNDSRDVLLGYSEQESSTTAEGKVIGCADGSIRYYQTRNDYGTVIYFESKDGGVTWTEFGMIPYMQTPKGSFGIGEDPENPGTWYIAWQNTWPISMGDIQPRIRISLARTTDGKNWEFMADVERTSTYGNGQHNHVRQFLDPDVEVTADYVYVSHGRSDTGEAGSSHNNQVPRYTRFEKDKLQARAWDDSTIWDSNKPKYIEITTLPQVKFGYSDLFTTHGGVVTEYLLNGSTIQKDFRNYAFIEEPNMFKLGKQTLQIYSSTLHTTFYEIEVVPNYDLIWTVKGKGSITPDPDGMLRMMEGASQTFDMKPAKGYKVGSVVINGKEVKVTQNAFTIENVQENQEITVTFVKLTIMDYLVWIILGVVVVAGIAVGAILLIKKQKGKPKAEDMEDISSNSTPPADEN